MGGIGNNVKCVQECVLHSRATYILSVSVVIRSVQFKYQ